LTPLRCRWESPFIERRSGVVRKERGQEHKEQAMSNTTTICGNLTREPEIRYTKEGQATTQLGVAVNRRWQDKGSGEWQETTSFFDVICWRDLAENVALSLSKGMRVVVTGRLEQRSWEIEDGEHRSKVEIVADEIGPSLRFATADVRRTLRTGIEDQPTTESNDTEVPSA
jgi:single-strand DNA-binding protein